MRNAGHTNGFQPILHKLYCNAISAFDCHASDTIKIEVNPIRSVYFANIFSPNGDGINDRYFVHSADKNVQIVRNFQIFDRWGTLLFQQKNIPPNISTQGWDGTFKGQKMGSGVYLFYAEIEFLDGEIIPFTGDLFLKR